MVGRRKSGKEVEVNEMRFGNCSATKKLKMDELISS
jgi:hypothetical protein